MMIILPFLVLLFSSSSSFLVLAQNLKLDCDPCIERANYNIKAITHGLSDELFWQKNKASMIEASKDMGVNFVMDLYDTFDSETMAADIRAAADGSVDALIVTIPSKEVQDAVADVKDTVSVFGFNQDLDDDFTRSLLGFVGSDEAEAGQVAGKQIVSLLEEDDVDKASGFLLNHAPELEGLEARIQNIQDATKDVVDWTVFKSDDIVRDLQNLTAALANCTYDVIQTLGTSPMKVTLSALDANDCMEDKKILGTFDVSTEIYDMLSTGMLDFSVSQQTYLQSSLPVVMASLYASTGLVLNVPTKFGKYLSGPKLVTADTLPSANIQACSEVAFPVCSSDDALLASQDDTGACACTNRPDIKLSVITHAQKGSAFWDTIYSAFDTAAMDMNVSLGASRFDAELTSAEVIEKQITAIEEACRSEIDGLIVSFPDASTVDAVKGCTEKGIPVVVINAGPDLAVDGGYHYIGQVSDANVCTTEKAISITILTHLFKLFCLANNRMIIKEVWKLENA
jgi:ABC-type sugar transport system substrate-binding protein